MNFEEKRFKARAEPTEWSFDQRTSKTFKMDEKTIAIVNGNVLWMDRMHENRIKEYLI